jgi:signal recognition particle receptor subunit beta
MVELNHRQRTIKVKIVYYGPAVGGKTTNLQVLHGNALGSRRGEMVSIHSAQDRTILFDLLPLKAAGFRGFELRLELAAVPGQAMYAATRRLVLKGADSVVFVANSAADRWDENVQSFREMAENLIAHQLDPASLPLVVQYNKRDLPEVTPVDFMERALNARRVPSFPAVAIRGEGVLETFGAVLNATMEDLAVRYQVVDLGRGLPLQRWVDQALTDMFGATSLGPPADDEVDARRPAVFVPTSEAPADRRSLRIDLPEDALRMASRGPSARANESLVDSYAEVTSRLGSDMSDLRDQHNRLRRWLDQLQALAAAAQEMTAGQPRESALRLALDLMVEAVASRHASLLLPAEGGALEAIALHGLADDPLQRLRSGHRVLERMAQDSDARLYHGADSLDLGEALQDTPPVFASVVSVPLRSAAGLHAIALLYFTHDDVLPATSEMQQLRALAAVLAPALELAARPAATEGGGDAGDRALHGVAAGFGLDWVLSALLRIRDGVAEARRDPALTPAGLAALGALTPALADALGMARALVAFAHGEPPPGDYADLADLVDEVSGTMPLMGERTASAAGIDPALLRVAVAALADHLRGGDAARVVHLAIRTAGAVVKLKLAAAGEGAAAADPSDPRLRLARRIAELQGGTLGEESEEGRTWLVLALPPG